MKRWGRSRATVGGRSAASSHKLVWLLALASAGACGELEEIDLGRCGNGVIDAGEDCDGYVEREGAEMCLPAGLFGQCRYACVEKETGGERYGCPNGWGCGSDGICREHATTLGNKLFTGQPAGSWFGVSDFDGDGFPDVASVNEDLVSIDYLEGGAYRQSYRLPLESVHLPSITRADGDTLADLVVPTSLGLAVLRGAPTRTLTPTTYASQSVLLDEFVFAGIDLVPEVADFDGTFRRFSGDESLAITSEVAFSVTGVVQNGVHYNTEIPTNSVKIDVAAIVGRVVAERFDEHPDVHGDYFESPEQLAIATPGEVTLYRPSYFVNPYGFIGFFLDATTEADNDMGSEDGFPRDDDPWVPPSHPGRTTIELPPGVSITHFMVAHANPPAGGSGRSRLPCGGSYASADAHLDLVVSAEEEGTPKLLFAFGLGDGRFHGDPCELEAVTAQTVVADDTFASTPLYDGCAEETLAVADTDGDGALDVVTATKTFASGLIPVGLEATLPVCSAVLASTHADEERFSEVVVGDFNGDAIDDVFGAIYDGGLQYVTWQNGVLPTYASYATASPASRLRTADYDGDGIADAAFGERLGDEDTVAVVFGERGKIPADPRSIGAVEQLIAIESADHATLLDEELDGADDLLVATKVEEDDATFRFAVLRGRADRQLQAPFLYSADAVVEGQSSPFLPFGASIAPIDGLCPDTGRALFMTGLILFTFDDVAPLAMMGAACVDERARLSVLGDTASALTFSEGSPIDVVRSAVTTMSLDGATREPVVATWSRDLEGRGVEIFAPVATGEGKTLRWEKPNAARIEGAIVAGAPAFDELAEPQSLLRTWAPWLSNNPVDCQLGPSGEHAVVFMALHDDGVCEGAAPEAVDRRARMEVHVLPAPAVLATRSGGLDGALSLGTEEGETILGVACMNADGDAAAELAVLTVLGPVPQCGEAPPEQYAARIRIAELDEHGELGFSGAPIAEIAAGEISIVEDRLDSRPPVSGLAAGDFNRDGVDDLYIPTLTTGIVWLGRPVLP